MIKEVFTGINSNKDEVVFFSFWQLKIKKRKPRIRILDFMEILCRKNKLLKL